MDSDFETINIPGKLILNENVKRDNLIEIFDRIITNEDFKFENLDIIVEPMRTIVEEADSIQDLLTCVYPLMTLAELYTADFVKIFEDTADLIIGWLVDPTSYQSDQDSYNQLIDLMIQLRPFWIASLKDSGKFFRSTREP